MIGAVVAAKLYHISATACLDADLPASLKALMLSDPNAQVLVKDLLREYPQWSHDCIAVVRNISSKNIQKPKDKAALIWMLGEYSQDIGCCSSIRHCVAKLVQPNEAICMMLHIFLKVLLWTGMKNTLLRLHTLHLLTAVMKCFLKRPPATQKALGATLAAGISDSHQDVHDRVLFYYRLLQYDPSVAVCVANPPKQAVSVFADSQSSEMKDRIFDEFNSLSVVYQKPSYLFTDKKHHGPFGCSEDLTNLSVGADDPGNIISAQRYQENDNDLLLSTSDKEDNGTRASNGFSTLSYNAPSTLISSSLLSTQSLAETTLMNNGGPNSPSQSNFSFDDLLGLAVTEALALPPQPTLTLDLKPVLEPCTS